MLDKYKEIRKIDRDELDHMCKIYNWCRYANDDEYNRVLDMTENEMTTENLVAIGIRIFNYSDTPDSVSNIIHSLSKACYSIFYLDPFA